MTLYGAPSRFEVPRAFIRDGANELPFAGRRAQSAYFSAEAKFSVSRNQ